MQSSLGLWIFSAYEDNESLHCLNQAYSHNKRYTYKLLQQRH